jgi:thiol-disulfide isomerase/thioredoxin
MNDRAIHAEDAQPDTFDALVFAPRGELVVVEFWGPDCPNCEVFDAAAPKLLEALAGERVRFVRLDAYAYPDVARRFAVFGIPCFLLVRDGKVLGRMSEFRGTAFWLGVVRDHLPGATGSLDR